MWKFKNSLVLLRVVGGLAGLLLCVAFSLSRSSIDELNKEEAESFRRLYISTASHFLWIGTLAPKLTVYPLTNITERVDVHMVILISKALCVAIARDIVAVNPGIDRTNAYFFFEDGQMWFCPVEKYLVHPDHEQGKRNSIALVFLYMPNDRFLWRPLPWSHSDETPPSARMVGITSTHKAGHVEQFREDLTKVDCNPRYDHDQEYVCYTEKRWNFTDCTYPPSMALVEIKPLTQYLIGISAGGHGCHTPSQWVLIKPFKAWIASHALEPMPDWSEPDQGMYDYYEDMDLELLSRLDEPYPEMMNATNQTELVLGDMDDTGECTSGELLYRDITKFKTITKGNIGTYSVSLFDTYYPTFSCVSLVAICKKKSLTRFWIQKGFGQDDIEFYIKQIPYSTNRTYARKVVFLMDAFRKYHHDDITGNLEFMFEFDEEATLHVQFRGRHVETTTDNDLGQLQWPTYPPTPAETTPRFTTTSTTTTTTTTTTEQPKCFKGSSSIMQRFGACDDEEKVNLIFRELIRLETDITQFKFVSYNMTLRENIEYTCLTLELVNASAVSEMHVKHSCPRAPDGGRCHYYTGTVFDIAVSLIFSDKCLFEMFAWGFKKDMTLLDTQEWKWEEGTYYEDFSTARHEYRGPTYMTEFGYEPLDDKMWIPEFDLWTTTGDPRWSSTTHVPWQDENNPQYYYYMPTQGTPTTGAPTNRTKKTFRTKTTTPTTPTTPTTTTTTTT